MFHPNLRFRFIKNQVAPRVRLFFGSSRQQRRQQRILGNGWSLYVFHFSQVYEFKIHVATNKIVSNTLSKRIILIFFQICQQAWKSNQLSCSLTSMVQLANSSCYSSLRPPLELLCSTTRASRSHALHIEIMIRCWPTSHSTHFSIHWHITNHQ